MSNASVDDMAGWIVAYRSAMREKRAWEEQKREWEKKWAPFLDPFKEQLFARLESEGADTGTILGEEVVKVKEVKRKGYEVKPSISRRVVLVETDEENDKDEDVPDID